MGDRLNMTDLEKRIKDLELAVQHLLRERFDLAYPPGHADRDAMMPECLKPKPETKEE